MTIKEPTGTPDKGTSDGEVSRFLLNVSAGVVAAAVAAAVAVMLRQPASVVLAYSLGIGTLAVMATVVWVVLQIRRMTGDVLHSVKQEGAIVTPVSGSRAFYDALLEALGSAKESLDVTHIRPQPPRELDANAEEWYAAQLVWLQGDRGRRERRIVSLTSAAMMGWAKDLQRASEQLVGLDVTVISWQADIPALNMAVFDGKLAFFALPGDTPTSIRGFHTSNPAIVQDMSRLFERLWRSDASLPLDAWFEQQRSNTEQGSTSIEVADRVPPLE